MCATSHCVQDGGIGTCPYSGQRFVSKSYLKHHPELHSKYTFVHVADSHDDDHH